MLAQMMGRSSSRRRSLAAAARPSAEAGSRIISSGASSLVSSPCPTGAGPAPPDDRRKQDPDVRVRFVNQDPCHALPSAGRVENAAPARYESGMTTHRVL